LRNARELRRDSAPGTADASRAGGARSPPPSFPSMML
jgi:hypothetical protein